MNIHEMKMMELENKLVNTTLNNVLSYLSDEIAKIDNTLVCKENMSIDDIREIVNDAFHNTKEYCKRVDKYHGILNPYDKNFI